MKRTMQTIATGSCSTFFSVNKYSDELMYTDYEQLTFNKNKQTFISEVTKQLSDSGYSGAKLN